MRPVEPGWQVRHEGDIAVLVLDGDWRRPDARPPSARAEAIVAALRPARRLRYDTTGLRGWDSLLVAVLWQLRRRAQADGIDADEDGLPRSARRLLALAADTPPAAPQRRAMAGPVAALGRATLSGLEATGAAAELLARLGASLGASLSTGGRRTRMQGSDLLDAVWRTGPAALPIVGVVNLLMGSILAFIGAAQLRRFAADSYVGDLVGLSLARELAAVMTAIVLAGRTGGANAARLASMEGNEEIDALRVLGISETGYLVLPMTLSLVLTMPLLYLYACLIGMAGGALVAVTVLDLSPLAFATALVRAVSPIQFAFGAAKSMAFALLIGIVSCQVGLRAGRNAAAVGEAATRAVVAGIVGIIALDAIFAVAADALGI